MEQQVLKRNDMKGSSNRFGKLVAISAGHFMNDFYMGLIPPISFIFADVLGLDMTRQGLLAFVITSFGSFAQPLVGGLVDRHGRPALLVGSVAWIAFWMSVAGWIRNFHLLLLAVALGALASALYHPLGSATVVALGKESKGKSLSVFMMIGGFSAAVAPAVALPLVETWGLNSLFYLFIPGVAVAGAMAAAGLLKMEGGPMSSGRDRRRSSLWETSRRLSVLVLVSINKNFIRRVLVAFGIQMLVYKGLDLKMAGIALSASLFMNPLGTMAGGFLNDRIGSRKTLLLSNSLAGVLMAGIIWGGGMSAWVAFIFLGACLSASNTPSVIIAHELLPDQASMGFGMVMGFAGGVGGLGLLLAGRISDVFGLPAAVWFMSVPTALLVALSVHLVRNAGEGRV